MSYGMGKARPHVGLHLVCLLEEETALATAFASYCPSASILGGEVAQLPFRRATGYIAAAEKQSCLHSMQWD